LNQLKRIERIVSDEKPWVVLVGDSGDAWSKHGGALTDAQLSDHQITHSKIVHSTRRGCTARCQVRRENIPVRYFWWSGEQQTLTYDGMYTYVVWYDICIHIIASQIIHRYVHMCRMSFVHMHI
jgi:hypothetical protein